MAACTFVNDAWRLLAASLGAFAMAGCGCHGGVVAVTDRVKYALGDEIHIKLVNGTSRHLEVPGHWHVVHFFRHVGNKWMAVNDRPPEIPPDVPIIEVDLLITMAPCGEEWIRRRVVPTLAPGEYRLQFPSDHPAWVTNAFVIETRDPHP